VHDLELSVCVEDGYEGRQSRRRLRAKFSYQDVHYLLSVTDPKIEDEYLIRQTGDYTIGRALLCISLSELWNGFVFRVVASIITSERYQALPNEE
jgi:hypothetical protein